MKMNIFFIIHRILITLLGVVSIFLQFYTLLDLETVSKLKLDSSIALALSIYICLLMLLVSLAKTKRYIEEYKNETIQ